MRKGIVIAVVAAAVVVLAASALAVCGVAGAAATFHPRIGEYKGSLRNSRTNVKFVLTDHPHLHVANFETILGHTVTRHFSHVQVHDNAFAWTSPSNVHIAGRWTGTNTITGTIRNQAGVVHHWAAESYGFARFLSSAAVTPKGGLYRSHLGGTRYLEFSYIAHSHTAHIFMIVHMEGARWISSRHYSGTKYVHDGVFDFTGYNHASGHYLEVVGR